MVATRSNSYSDLFRALKGGANRFGIVTRYDVSAVHTGTKHEKSWFGGAIYVRDILTNLILMRCVLPSIPFRLLNES